ncbi:MAG: hypothetical protein LUC32_06095 [Clostridiales bacterium]|nr:hypothetical protein [Clostridiales bacterium]
MSDGFSDVINTQCDCYTPNVYIPTAKLIDNIFGMGAWDPYHNAEADIRVSPKYSKKPAYVQAMIRLSQPIDIYDWVVFVAFCSLVYDGLAHGEREYICTAKQILRKMTGKKSNCTQASAAIHNIEVSMAKMFATEIDFAWGEHAAMARIDTESCGLPVHVERDHLIPARIIMQRLKNGQTVVAYRVLEVPALYKYAKIVSQVETLDDSVIDMEINNTPRNIALKFVLLKRIIRIKNPKSVSSNVIRMDWIFDTCQIPVDCSRTEAKRVKDTVYRILDSLMAKQYIAGYDKLTTGRTVDRVKIRY